MSSSTELEATRILAEAGAVITESHVVYTSGKHGSAYVNKDALYTKPKWVDQLCEMIAVAVKDDMIDVVVAPAIGGVNLTSSVVRVLQLMTSRDIRAVYAEHQEESIFKAMVPLNVGISISGHNLASGFALDTADELLIRQPTFVIKRGYDKLVIGKRVLVVEDVLTTGGSARETVRAVRRADGLVVGAAAICNRGNVIAEDLEVSQLRALISVDMAAYDEDKCPLCTAGVPINTEVGKGKQFLARKQASS